MVIFQTCASRLLPGARLQVFSLHCVALAATACKKMVQKMRMLPVPVDHLKFVHCQQTQAADVSMQSGFCSVMRCTVKMISCHWLLKLGCCDASFPQSVFSHSHTDPVSKAQGV